MRYIFDIDKIMTGRKRFKLDRVGITTSGVRVSVHFKNVPKLGVVNITDPDEQSLAQSIANLSLNPQDNDGSMGNNGHAHNNDIGKEQVENNNIGEEPMNVQVMENMVDNHANNEIEEEAMGGNFVDVGHDPVVRLNLNGMFFFLCFVFHYLFPEKVESNKLPIITLCLFFGGTNFDIKVGWCLLWILATITYFISTSIWMECSFELFAYQEIIIIKNQC
jgi:hypothetical protein